MFMWNPPSHCTGTVCWQNASNGSVPHNAVKGGQDKDGGPIYVGRAMHQGDLLPAKICPTHGCAFVCYSGEEIAKQEYEAMISTHTGWASCQEGDVPDHAIQVGQTCNGEPLYVGRILLEGTLTIGKVHPSHRCLYVPYNGKEEKYREYEVLILN